MIHFKEEKINISDNSYLKKENKNLNFSKENNLFYKNILFINLILIIFINIKNINQKNKFNEEMENIEKYFNLCKYYIKIYKKHSKSIF